MPRGYMVVFNDDAGHTMISDKRFLTLSEAESYADGVAPSRLPRIYPAVNFYTGSDGEFSCHDIEDMARLVADVKDLFTFSFDEAGCRPKTSHHVCQALNYLSQAYHSMMLAHYEQIEN